MYKVGDYIFGRSSCNALPAPGIIKKIISGDEVEIDLWHPTKNPTAFIVGTDFIAPYMAVKIFVMKALEKADTERSRKFVLLAQNFESSHIIEKKNLIIFKRDTTNQIGVYINNRLSDEEIEALKREEEQRRATTARSSGATAGSPGTTAGSSGRTINICRGDDTDEDYSQDDDDDEVEFSTNIIENETKLVNVLQQQVLGKFKIKIGSTYASVEDVKNALENINCEIYFKGGKSAAAAFEGSLQPVVERKYQCGYCHGIYESPPALVAHLVKDHDITGPTRLHCPKCQKLINCLDRSATYHAEYHLKKRKDISREEFSNFKAQLKKAAKIVRKAVREEGRALA